MGDDQTVAADGSVTFPADDTHLDIVGTSISMDATGTIFNLLTPGLYHVEWSAHLGTAMEPIFIGILDNDDVATAISGGPAPGNISSGALIYVAAGQTPYPISLHNFGNAFSLTQSAPGVEATAVSLRIVRFADAPEAP